MNLFYSSDLFKALQCYETHSSDQIVPIRSHYVNLSPNFVFNVQ